MEKAPEAFRTISEVADELSVPKHVLRFWEAKFTQLKPMKRGGGRRYYRPEDVSLLRGIRFLLYDDGYTIRGVQKLLRENGPRYVMDYTRRAEEAEEGDDPKPRDIPDVAAEAAKSMGVHARRAAALHAAGGADPEALSTVLHELEACRKILVQAKD